MPYPAQTDPTTVLHMARALIEREGVEQLSLARLATALGTKAPSLYRHMDSKDALLRSVVTLFYQELFTAYDTALHQAGDQPRAQLQGMLQAHRAFAHANPQTYSLAFTISNPAQRADAQMLEQMVLPVQQIMAELTGAEQSLPALRGALALVHGWVMLELNAQFQRGGDLDAAFATALDAYLAGWELQAAQD